MALCAKEWRSVGGDDAVGDVLGDTVGDSAVVLLETEVVVFGIAGSACIDVGVSVAVLGDGSLAIGGVDEDVAGVGN